mmetsp:Transcript_25380/g.76435  ORF Transcript_25380/g.76435 Transcript_25380/m.76435 type:complete len:133 (-) Transcript_25380:364-762(-)
MALRVERAQANTVALAAWLGAHEKVTKVYYATTEDHPDRALHLSQATGGGCVVCFTTGDVDLSKHVVSETKLFAITVSFGSVRSLISCPCDMSHASIPAETRARVEIKDRSRRRGPRIVRGLRRLLRAQRTG